LDSFFGIINLVKYAVIQSGGKQYRVSEGDVIEIDRLSLEKEKVSFDNVLLLVSEGVIKIGKPFITGEKVQASLVENLKGDKIRVSKYKAKVRYRKTIGFRPFLSRVKIEKVGNLTSVKKVADTSKKK